MRLLSRPPFFTAPGDVLFPAQAIGIDDFQSNRSPTERYRAAPLQGLWTHAKGGCCHDARFETVEDVIQHDDERFNLGLDGREVRDLAS